MEDVTYHVGVPARFVDTVVCAAVLTEALVFIIAINCVDMINAVIPQG